MLSKRAPLWLSRPLLNWQDIYRWGIEKNIKRMHHPDDLHTTIATARGNEDWSLLGDLRTDTITVRGGRKVLEALGKRAMTIRFEDDDLAERQAELAAVMVLDHGDEYRPHVTITQGHFRNFETSYLSYNGPLIFGPETVEVFHPTPACDTRPINSDFWRKQIGMKPLKTAGVDNED